MSDLRCEANAPMKLEKTRIILKIIQLAKPSAYCITRKRDSIQMKKASLKLVRNIVKLIEIDAIIEFRSVDPNGRPTSISKVTQNPKSIRPRIQGLFKTS